MSNKVKTPAVEHRSSTAKLTTRQEAHYGARKFVEEKEGQKRYEDVEDKEYYSALQNSLNGYDAKMWQVPGLFFVIVGILVRGLDRNDFWSSWYNGIFLIVAAVLIGLLLVYYNKAHLFFLLIQEKINDFDDYYNKANDSNNAKKIRRIPLSSMPPEDLISRLSCLVKNGRLKIHPIRYGLANLLASSCIRWLMFFTFIITFVLGLVIIIMNFI